MRGAPHERSTSGITQLEDDVFDRLSMQFTNDDLGRLVEADRGLLSAGAITKNNYIEGWTLGQTGNWAVHQLDLDGDGVLTGTGELDEVNPLGGMSPHFNEANELVARDLDGDGSDDDTQLFDDVGNLVDDGRDFKYIYDAFGRLVEVTDQSDNTVAAYGYNGLNHRISWHYDVTGSGGGPVPDGSVNGSDPVFYFVYNERWQHMATYRGADANPKEQFLVPHRRGCGVGLFELH